MNYIKIFCLGLFFNLAVQAISDEEWNAYGYKDLLYEDICGNGFYGLNCSFRSYRILPNEYYQKIKDSHKIEISDVTLEIDPNESVTVEYQFPLGEGKRKVSLLYGKNKSNTCSIFECFDNSCSLNSVVTPHINPCVYYRSLSNEILENYLPKD